MCLLLLKYESERLPEATGDSPDYCLTLTLFDVKLSIKFFTTFNFFVNPVLFLSLFGHAMSNFLTRERFGDF